MIPAVDIMGGKVVRLLKGSPNLVRSYEFLGDPLLIAKRWESEGAPAIHIVDLDAALGMGENTELISRIIQYVDIPVQVGGGIKNTERACRLIEAGAEKVILGSLAFRNIEAIKSLLRKFGFDRIIIALDHLNGEVVVDGWKTRTGIMLEEAAQRFSSIGIKFFLVTSTQHDGMMDGTDIRNLLRVLNLGVNVIASGGIRSLNDVVTLKGLGVYGIIVGRALYEGLFSLKEALKVAL
ncbi:MAG: 1-(5-phosphoribosyl)-5-[(5-phosphoribosylamino)methylideneamino]imidazole-4-carboxamide isomerase [Candidatus Bathyarchaeia archaeon]